MAKSKSGSVIQQRREHWQQLLERWRASGLSQAAFCRRQGISVWKLAWWRKRLKGPGNEAAGLFVPVHVAPTVASHGELELTLRGGRMLRFGADVPVGNLVEIVSALEARPC